MERRRVAVTGIGVLAPCGIGRDAFWAGLSRVPTDDVTRSVEGFDPLPFFANAKEARRIDRFAQFGLACAAEALEQADALGVDPARTGVWIGTGVGGLNTLEDQILTFHEKGPRRVNPFLVPMMMSNAASAAVSMRYGWQGPCETTVTACAAGTHSVANAANLIRAGVVDTMVTGGTESALTPVGIQGFRQMTALSNSGRSQPFSADRDGFVMAEAAAVLVLEGLDTAQARGATVLAEILGSASGADAHHITAPSPGGSGAVNCMERALLDANLTAADIGQINAHGTSTPLNDAAEAEAIVKVFGAATDSAADAPGPPAVSAIKGVTGHSLGAAGAVEAAALVLSMVHAEIPPTMGTTVVDPELAAIDLVMGSPRSWEPAPALSNSFGFGGHNGTLVIGPASA